MRNSDRGLGLGQSLVALTNPKASITFAEPIGGQGLPA